MKTPYSYKATYIKIKTNRTKIRENFSFIIMHIVLTNILAMHSGFIRKFDLQYGFDLEFIKL